MKVFGQAFFKKLAGDERGRRPPLFCAARNAKQKRPCQPKQRSVFWRPRFTRPLRAGKRANANFACSEGFFCAQCAAPCGGLAVLARPAAVVAAFVTGAPAFFPPVCRCLVPNRRAGHRFLFGLRCRRPAAVCGTSRWCARVLWLCSRPACRVACRFCADFCARCLVCPPCAFVCACFLSCFLPFSCLTFASQNSFHLSLRPRRGFPFLSAPAA